MSIRNHPTVRDLAATGGLDLTEAECAAVFEANGMWPEVAEAVDRIVAARLVPIEALITGWSGGTGHKDTNKWVSVAALKAALAARDAIAEKPTTWPARVEETSS